MDIRQAVKGTETQKTSTPEEIKVPTVEPEPELTPEDREFTEYVSFLEKNGIGREELLAMLETIVTTGNFEMSDTLFDGRLEVRFRMRATWVENLIAKRIDALRDDTTLSVARFSSIIRVLNAAGSLASYKDRVFSMETEDDFASSLAFVEALPYPVLSALCNKLAVFDRAVAVATSEQYLENFTTPPKAAL